MLLPFTFFFRFTCKVNGMARFYFPSGEYWIITSSSRLKSYFLGNLLWFRFDHQILFFCRFLFNALRWVETYYFLPMSISLPPSFSLSFRCTWNVFQGGRGFMFLQKKIWMTSICGPSFLLLPCFDTPAVHSSGIGFIVLRASVRL